MSAIGSELFTHYQPSENHTDDQTHHQNDDSFTYVPYKQQVLTSMISQLIVLQLYEY